MQPRVNDNHQECHQKPGAGIGHVVIPSVDSRKGDQHGDNIQKPADPFRVSQNPPSAECRRESSSNVSAGKDAGMNPVTTQHPPVEAAEDRVIQGKVLSEENHPRRLRRPERELRIAQQHAQAKDKEKPVGLRAPAVHVEHDQRKQR